MAENDIHTVTGAFGYSGRYIATMLLVDGQTVNTITNSTERHNPFGDRIGVYPLHFDSPEKLTESLRGTRVLYNTYWVRFNYKQAFTHSLAVHNSLTLFECAEKAGVEKVVHVSITNPSIDSDLEYFRGKAILEDALLKSGLGYAILRPAVLFGKEDILINNIAWFLRRFPIFGVFGDGSYRLQPIYVKDLARIAVNQGRSADNAVIEAIGPETFTFRQLVTVISEIIGKRRQIISLHPAIGLLVSKAVGALVNDVVLTQDEIKGLMEGRLFVDAPPAGWTSLTGWAAEHAATLGQSYTSEIARRENRVRPYASN